MRKKRRLLSYGIELSVGSAGALALTLLLVHTITKVTAEPSNVLLSSVRPILVIEGVALLIGISLAIFGWRTGR